MKSTMKKLTAIILVLVLTLSLFAGCNSGSSVKTSGEYLLSEYGMTFSGSSVTYDGSAHSISVSATSSSGYSVSYSYLSGNTEVSQAGVTDAGTYEVVATITETDGEIFYLSEDLTITPASLSVSVPDQYIRKGSDADDVEDVFEDLELLGSDTIKSIGMAWDLSNIDDLDAMDDVSDGKALGVTITSGNYTLSVTKGTLYVLSYADYTAVTTLKLDVTNLEAYGERFDELTYTENSAYISAAGRVLDVFENEEDYTSIQVAMMGSVSQTEISTNLAIAEKRKIQGYDLDWDTSGDISTSDLSVTDDEVWGAVNVVAAYYDEDDEVLVANNKAGGYTVGDDKYVDPTLNASSQIYVEDDDGDDIPEARFYIDNGFLIDYDGRDDEDTYDDYEEAVKYGDYFYFVMKYYDNDSYENEYVIEQLLVRNKETSYDSATVVYIYKDDNGEVLYSKDNEVTNEDGYTGEMLYVYKMRADSTTVGALGAGTTIEVIVEDIAKYNIKFDTTDDDTSNAQVSTFTISGDTNGTIFSLANLGDDVADEDYFKEDTTDAGYVTVGEEVTLTIYMKEGYYISQILIGDYEIDGSDLSDGKITFTVEEDMFGEDAGGVAEIEVYTGKSYDISMKINSRTVRSTTGEYEGTTGTVEIDGSYVSGSTVYVIEGTTLDFTFLPDDNYSVSSVTLYFDEVEYTSSNKDDFTWDATDTDDGDDWDYGEKYGASIELIDEISSNKISIDFSDDCDYFDFEDIGAATTMTISVTFSESWSFSVESDDVVFKQNAAGEFVSDYGTISILDYDDDIMTSVLKYDYFMVYAELEPGYYISSMKINNSSAMSSVTLAGSSTKNGYTLVSTYIDDSIDDGEMYFFKSSDKNTANPSFGTTVEEEADFFVASYSNIDAGDDIVIEVTFGTYYELDVDNDAGKVEVTYGTENSDNADVYSLSDGTTVIFGDDDSSKLTLTFTYGLDWWTYYYKQHTGESVADSTTTGASGTIGGYLSFSDTDSSDLDTDISKLYYYIEVEGEEIDDFSYSDSSFRRTSSFLKSITDATYTDSYTIQTKEVSIDFDDLMDLVSPGDEIVIVIYDDVEWDD